MPEPASNLSTKVDQGFPRAGSSDALIRALRGLLIASALLPMTILSILAWQSRQATWQSAESAVGEAVDILEEHGLRIFEADELVLDLIALRTAGLSWAEIEESREVTAFLKDVDREHVAALWLIDGQGRVRASSTPLSEVPEVDRLDFFAAHRAGNVGTFVGRAYANQARAPFFTISRRRPAADGQFDGVIAVVVSVAYFEKFFTTVARQLDHTASLVRNDGDILARAPRLRQRVPLSSADPLMRSMAAVDTGMLWVTTEAGGAAGLYGYRRLGSFPVNVIFGLETSTILQPWYRMTAVYAAIGTSVSLALVLLSWIALRNVRQERAAVARLHAEVARRRDIEEALHHSQKLEAIGQLTGGIAHDFNNLLTTVLGSLDLLDERNLDPRARQLVSSAMRAGERGARLTRQLLAFARKQRFKTEAVDLNALIRDTSDTLSRTIGPPIEIELKLAADLWPVQIDANQLELAILNVAVNARDALPLGGLLLVETANLPAGATERPPQLAPGDYVLLAITDNGIGMSDQVKARAFEPFFTTKEVGKGSGLGLSQVYGIASQAGGTVTLESWPGLGTTIRIYLPRGSTLPTAQPASLEAPVTQVTGHGRILLVEDDPQVREFIRICLDEAGYTVAEAGNGPAALKLLESESIDLLITDFAMPGMNGAELAMRVRTQRPYLPVLLITGYMDEPAVPQPSDIPILPILRKPLRQAELLARVNALIGLS